MRDEDFRYLKRFLVHFSEKRMLTLFCSERIMALHVGWLVLTPFKSKDDSPFKEYNLWALVICGSIRKSKEGVKQLTSHLIFYIFSLYSGENANGTTLDPVIHYIKNWRSVELHQVFWYGPVKYRLKNVLVTLWNVKGHLIFYEKHCSPCLQVSGWSKFLLLLTTELQAL